MYVRRLWHFLNFIFVYIGYSITSGYVGYSPSLQSVVVAHQGTDPVRMFVYYTDCISFVSFIQELPSEAIIADVAFVPTVLNPDLFPGVTFPVLVHGGFALQHAR